MLLLVIFAKEIQSNHGICTYHIECYFYTPSRGFSFSGLNGIICKRRVGIGFLLKFHLVKFILIEKSIQLDIE